MNFLQIVNRVRQNCGVSGADYVTTAGLQGEGLRLCNWVAEAYQSIQAMREDWQWMRKTIAFPTMTGRATYSAALMGITDFGMWARDTWRNYANPIVSISISTPAVIGLQSHNLDVGDTIAFQTSGALPAGITAGVNYFVLTTPTPDSFTISLAAGGTPISTTGTQNGNQTITSSNTDMFIGFLSEVNMEYLEYDLWRDAYQFGALREVQTRPLVITITPNKAIGLGPFPVTGYTIVGDYYSKPIILANDADVPALPDKFHLAIVYAAMKAYGQYEAAPDVLARAGEYDTWIRRIHADQAIEIGTGGPLA